MSLLISMSTAFHLSPGPEPSLHPLSGIAPLLDSTASWPGFDPLSFAR